MSRKKLEITVVIPFYKAEKYFQEALDSVLSQSYQADEIIIVVDGLEEHDLQFFEKLESDKISIVYLEKNLGPGMARNEGVSKAKHDWIAFLDADDKWANEKLLKQVQYLERHQDYIGCHTGTHIFREDKILSTYIDKPALLQEKHLVVSSQVCPPCLLIKRKVYNELGGMDARFRTSEDYEFSLRLVKTGYKLGFVPEPLVMVRRENHGNSSSDGWNILRNKTKILLNHRDVFLRNGGLISMKKFFGNACIEGGGKLEGIKGKMLKAIGVILR